MNPEIPTNTASSVPWTGLDVLLIFALWFVAQITCGLVAGFVDSSEPIQAVTTDKADSGHPLAQMVKQGKNSPIILLTAFLAAVVIAPIVEEFLFRMLLQGWLEAKFIQSRVPSASSTAIVAVSLFFASIHGGNSSLWNIHVLMLVFVITIIANLLVLTFGISFLMRKRHVSLRRYFFGEGNYFPPQFFIVMGYCILILFCIYGLTAVLGSVYRGENITPIPIFFFSLLLGTLYSKTQNLSYCILLHACLNGTSLTLVLI